MTMRGRKSVFRVYYAMPTGSQTSIEVVAHNPQHAAIQVKRAAAPDNPEDVSVSKVKFVRETG